MTATILIINGPNLNMLGTREPELYGHETLRNIEDNCRAEARVLGLKLQFFQSNHEGEIVERIQKAVGKVAGIVINPAAYTHTSIAIRDALSMIKAPIIEVHLSDLSTREPFRQHSYVSDLAHAVITGQRGQGYVQALQILAKLVK